jgi:hypothetical protein
MTPARGSSDSRARLAEGDADAGEAMSPFHIRRCRRREKNRNRRREEKI